MAGWPAACAAATPRLGALTATSYRGPVCIEVEDDTFGKTLEGRKRAVRMAGSVLRPFFA